MGYLTTFHTVHGIPSANGKRTVLEKEIEDNRCKVSFPHFNPECPVCGNCKTKLLQRLQSLTTKTVLIGDGISDLCLAKRVSFVFAKNGLFEACKKNNLNVYRYSHFPPTTFSLTATWDRAYPEMNLSHLPRCPYMPIFQSQMAPL